MEGNKQAPNSDWEALQESFEVKERLGSGGFAVVHRCINKKSQEEFAVKIVKTDQLKSSELEKLDREARICGMLKHPNIVVLHDNFKDATNFYFVFDLVTGGELFNDIVSRDHYSERCASMCMKQIVETIKYCHGKNVMHRDLKPENLLLTVKSPGAPLKVADFGLATELQGSEPMWYGFCGTPGYMAPEVMKMVPYNQQVDMWACGVILFILLSGSSPFQRSTDDKAGIFSFDSMEWRSVSVAAKELIMAMLQVDPKKRISADEALQTSWLSSTVEIPNIHKQDTVDKLKEFNARRKLKAAMFSALVITAALNKYKFIHFKLPLWKKLKIAHVYIIGRKIMQKQKVNSGGKAIEDSIGVQRREIISLTGQLLLALINREREHYEQMVVPHITVFTENCNGDLSQGPNVEILEFTKEMNDSLILGTSIIDPYVHLLGDKMACIAYLKSSQYQDGKGENYIKRCSETRLWQKLGDGKWHNIHVHSSQVRSKDEHHHVNS